MKKFLFLFLLAVCSGCIQVDYTGRKFAPTGNVTHYPSLEEFKARANQDDYTLIGRFTATAGRKKHPRDVDEKILEYSREFGGDVLCSIDMEKRHHGQYDKSEYEFGALDPRKRAVRPLEQGKFGPIVPLTADREKVTRFVYTFYLYKKSADVKEQLKK